MILINNTKKGYILKKIFLMSLIALVFVACDGKKSAFVKNIPSQNDFNTTLSKLEKLITSKKLTLFETINHSKNANNVKMDLKPEAVVVFGNPKMGTILMQCNPTMGLDLPLRILVHSDYEGVTTLSYTNPEYWTLKHNIKEKKCLEIITKAKIALENLVAETAKK